jgi:hypothetical protein
MKNRSSVIVIAVLLLLCAVSFFLYKKKGTPSTLDKEARNFKIEDTASITKIFIADKNGAKVTLERTKKGWYVNDRFPARTDAIGTLLYTMKLIDVKSPVSNTAKKNVLSYMAARAVKVQVFSGDELIKQYYVGHENQEMDGTYMLLTDIESGENYEDPFITFIPGFEGYLSSRYFIKEEEWRDRVIINYIPPQLKEIKVEHLETPDSSFHIKLHNTTDFTLKKLNGEVLTYEMLQMKQYLAYFQNISYEFLLGPANKRLVDSIASCLPYQRLTITDTKNQTRVFNFIRKPSTPEINRKYEIQYKYDPDRCYLRFNEDKETAIVQFYVFGKVLPTYLYFLPKNNVKK